MGPLIVTSDAELCKEEVQAGAEAAFVLNHPAGLDSLLIASITEARRSVLEAKSLKSRHAALNTLKHLLVRAERLQDRVNGHPGRAYIGA